MSQAIAAPDDAILLPQNYQPRDYQRNFWEYMENGGRRYVGIWHRRAGKDHTAFAWTTKAAFMRVGLYWHILPTYEMGRKILWNGIAGDGMRFRDMFPKQVVARTRDDNMLTELVNGSIHQVVGTDDPDRLVGANPVGCVFSEYSLQNPAAWELIRPILNENGGWAVFIYTPRGRNHGYHLYEAAQRLDSWFGELLNVKDTRKIVTMGDGRTVRMPVVTREAIQEDRDSGMSEEMIEQEYFCSFDAPFVGAIWGKEMREIREAGRICDVPYDPNLPVETWWDIGVNDETAIWFVQHLGKQKRFIDCEIANDRGIADWIKVVKDKPYVYSRHIGPWDLAGRDAMTAKRRVDNALELGLRFEVAAKTNVADGLNEVRKFFRGNQVFFDRTKCENGIDALFQYVWKEDKNGNRSEQPKHDWASHPADAIRTGVMMHFESGEDHRSTFRPSVADNDYDILSGTDSSVMSRGMQSASMDDYDALEVT